MNSTIQTLNKTWFNPALGKGAVREGDKILCLRVYKYLRGLTYLIDPSDELRGVLARDMFVKSNPKAFFHVMHYLFMALDPIEFKHRFYWPLDKNTENTFRTKTVQYLNDLNMKYELELGIVQTFIVVMPGGTKFLTVLLKLLRLVMRDVIRKKQRIGNLNDIKLIGKSEHFSKKYMAEMSLKSKLWHKKSNALVSKYSASGIFLENYTLSLKHHLKELINPQAANIKFNLYSVKSNENEIKQILSHQLTAFTEQSIHFENYTNILNKFKTIVQNKISTNSRSLVQFDSTQLQKSTVLLTKYNNELDSNTNRLIKLKLSNLFVPNKTKINLIELYDIIIFFGGQIKHQFFNHFNVNVKNLQINANVLDQYLIRLNKNSVQLTNLKCLINKYKESIDQGMLDSTKLNTRLNISNTPGIKVNIMITPRLKWKNLNDISLAQQQAITPHRDHMLCSNNNNTILLSARLSSKKSNRSGSKRTRFSELTENLNLDSTFELKQSTASKVSTSLFNKFNKLSKNVKTNLNANKFKSPETNQIILPKDRIYKSILKNRTQPVVTENMTDVSLSPTGKYDSIIKINSEDDTDETLLFKKTSYSTNEETITNRPGSSTLFIGGSEYMNTNSGGKTQKIQVTLGDDESELEGITGSLEKCNLENLNKLQRPATLKAAKSSANKLDKQSKHYKINLNVDKFESPETLVRDPVILPEDRIVNSILKHRKHSVTENSTDKTDKEFDDTIFFQQTTNSTTEKTVNNDSSFIDNHTFSNNSSEIEKTQITIGGDNTDESGLEVLQTSDNMITPLKERNKSSTDSSKLGCKYPYRIIDTIDLTESIERAKPPTSSHFPNRCVVADENNCSSANGLVYSTNDNNLLDTSDSCLNDITLLDI